MAWVYLIIAGLIEIGWAIGLKYSEGFTKLIPASLTIIGMIVSYIFLAQALKTIPLGTGYAVWTGIGAAGTAILGIILFSESVHPVRILCLILIVAGILGLKLSSGH
jgi:quaternary ammonium compound-resistance protein SugE